ncbi:hypothetical protein AAFF_G00364660 [Aldrovandia affinis]|uniref:AIG1-type G domain-containing protein n=1 Tax=Aldrovandia affinis TaxID=143900 RepID=A0AAD7WNR6_9TELE|nr:hypothetical protein AAFF_G00364660 [Aldrovandia affinis]
MSGQELLKDMRIVLVGKTGVGKSAAANTILGRKAFKSELTPSSVTSQCEKTSDKVDERDVAMVDTPGLFDTRCSNDVIINEIGKCICLSSPGPHVFLVVIQLGRFTEEEQETVKILQKTFGPDSAKYMMVLFTNGDRLKNKTIEEYLKNSPERLRKLIQQCHGGYHVFNNEKMENRSQVTELLQKIDKLVVENGGCCYTNEMYREAEEGIEEEKRRILRMNEEERRRVEQELKDTYKGEALEKATEELRKQQERTAREKAEKDNSFLKKLAKYAQVAFKHLMEVVKEVAVETFVEALDIGVVGELIINVPELCTIQ